MRAPDSREANLPKWAQYLIDGLRARISEAERATRLMRGEEASRVTLGARSDDPQYLPARQTIRFQLDEADSILGFVEVRLRGDHIEIMGGRGIAVLPRAANVVHITLEGD